MEKINKKPSFWVSLLPIIMLAIFLAVVIILKGADALDGGSQFALILSTAVATALSMGLYGVKWEQLEHSIASNIFSSSGSILIFLFIGAIAGTWMVSGVVPTLICYGLQILHPSVFLVSACLICAVVSVVTGSSWTTCATLGVALMGIGYSNGFPEWWTAGAVISGAYFGDKMSALSDTTVLAASTAKVPLFAHIRYMMYTTVPTFIITLLIYTIAGLCASADSNNIGRGRGGVDTALGTIKSESILIGIDSDQLFPVCEQKHIASCIPGAVYHEITSEFGHDGFLLENDQLTAIIEPLLP